MASEAEESRSTPCVDTPLYDLDCDVPFSLSYQALEYIVAIPSAFESSLVRCRTTFYRTFAVPADQTTTEPSPPDSVLELVSRFLSTMSDQVECSGSPSADLEALRFLLQKYEANILQNSEIHAFLAKLPDTGKKSLIIKSYYKTRKAIERAYSTSYPNSALMSAALTGEARIFAIFGGQGNTEAYFQEMRDTRTTYPSLTRPFLNVALAHLNTLARSPEASRELVHGLDVAEWLDNPSKQPPVEYLVSAPVSLPLIGLIQLLHFAVTCKILGMHPGGVVGRLAGSTGHSQGIVTAAAISASTDWESYLLRSKQALTILFWIGVRSQVAYPQASLAPVTIKDSENNGEYPPSPALSVRGLSHDQLKRYIEATNKHLTPHHHIAIGLVNGPRNLVVTGPPMSLYGLNLLLRRAKCAENVDDARIPFSQRNPRIVHHFLPMSVPFHSSYLESAAQKLIADLRQVRIASSELAIPLYSTCTGQDLRENPEAADDIVPSLIKMICVNTVHWEQATLMRGASHILDFGPAGATGVAGLTSRLKEGTGARVILATTSSHESLAAATNANIGHKHEVTSWDSRDIVYAPDWAAEYGPKLARMPSGQVIVDSAMSRLIGLPPIMVAGMTPTTVPWDFVATAMTAGYEVELAGGGYSNESDLSLAISKLEAHMPAGRGIVLNLIYANPKAIAWQIPLIRRLCDSGVPIKGITFGAGVPSVEVANEYIRSLGIRQIGFKPGSIKAVTQVIAIAQANPNFPVIMQWTGGRGGGHHSCEDFHEPILSWYGQVRRCSNIILVAGSGFGSADDIYPYLTGMWSSARFNRPAMPFDGVLMGSRCMVAKEAHTSREAKQEITSAVGLEDHEWEKTYQRPAGGGGIMTVRSEMGEPIHKLATRGVMLWAELDETFFSLSKEKRQARMQEKQYRAYIMRRLNADYQKPWFGRSSSGDVVEIEEMTYSDVAHRLVDLLYITHQQRWIHPSHAKLTNDFMQRIDQRFRLCYPVGRQNFQIDFSKDLEDPSHSLEEALLSYPQAKDQLMDCRDIDYFLSLCKRSGQKPVPFVPCLNEDFEVWFKKDSLWQAEDLDAVVGRDVGRVCILQGPVAARSSRVADQPIKDILDSIHCGIIEKIVKDKYLGDKDKIPAVGWFGNTTKVSALQGPGQEYVNGVSISHSDGKICYTTASGKNAALPDRDEWIDLIASGAGRDSWIYAFLMAKVFVKGKRYEPNPIRRMFFPSPHVRVEISRSESPATMFLSVMEFMGDSAYPTMKIGPISGKTIPLSITEHRTPSGKPAVLRLLFTYNPESSYAPIHEVMPSRNFRVKQFYHDIWFNAEEPAAAPDCAGAIISRFDGGFMALNASLIRDFVDAVGNSSDSYVPRLSQPALSPLDFGIVIGWKALLKPLFHAIEGDLLQLVHLSNRFRVEPGSKPLKEGDVVHSSSEISAITIQDSGKIIEISALLARKTEEPVMHITSQFLYRGVYSDFENTFQRRTEKPLVVELQTPAQAAVLSSKSWFRLYNGNTELLGQKLVFHLKSFVKFSGQKTFSSVKTTGTVNVQLSGQTAVPVGFVNYAFDGPSQTNPVLEYLHRVGAELDQPVYLKNPIPLSNEGDAPYLSFQAPSFNERYARASGDYNPIHVSRTIAEYVGLPGTISHGMCISSMVRALVERYVADASPYRMREYYTKFSGMVMPGDLIEVRLHHVAMSAGSKFIKIEATKANGAEEKVVVGEAVIDEVASAYVFAGQGSQEQGMGMDLYKTSSAAREVWDRANKHLLDTFGFSILEIVRHNPKELTVHFGGLRGSQIRDNYMSMTYQTGSFATNGILQAEKVFKGITPTTASHTFRFPKGLLHATQFTQPALTLMEMAAFQDLKARGVIQKDSMFAGHSLGEYSALSCIAEIMPVETLVSVVFYRGLCMQIAVERDEAGVSEYAMCAVNPSRLGADVLSEDMLLSLVETIHNITGSFIEVVNFNVRNMQYVCAGELRGLDILMDVLNNIASVGGKAPGHECIEGTGRLISLIHAANKQTEAKPMPLQLTRGVATIPLDGIDVPFHSTYLRSGVESFRSFLLDKLPKTSINPDRLVGKYIPNVTARPFELTKEFFGYVYDITQSTRVSKVLEDWDKYQQALDSRSQDR